ncbi:MAG: DUF1553 domain-containing protein [Planctomycetes bacterium]|nr:DUF1553 domain-containing protein [Planctomycetota bacterium]
MRKPSAILGLILFLVAPALARADDLQLFPGTANLRGKSARQQLLVTSTSSGKSMDHTRTARFESLTPGVIAVSPAGVVTPVGDGAGTVVARVGKLEARATFTVVNGKTNLPVTFERDVQPIMARFGCNAGACHGKQRGQNGFQLSLLGFDADFDFNALTQEARGRRIFPASPQNSLLLTKPTGEVPHGGGRRLQKDDVHYQTLLRWIKSGIPRTPTNAPTLERITIEPGERLLLPFKKGDGGDESTQQLLITAHYSDKTTEDVTHLTMFQSNESVIASVDAQGRVKAGPLPGEAAIMARFMEKFAVCTIVIPMPGSISAEVYARLPRKNFIDDLVYAKLQRLGITPSQPCGDATFQRRAFLDAIGRLPTPDETRAFLADPSSDKRIKLIDRLLDRPEYGDYWANKWADLLRPNPYHVGIKAVFTLDGFLRDSFRANKPYDKFVREILTAQGSTWRNGAVVMYRDRRKPDELTTLVSQLFLGIRLECAKCHHHPFEVYAQDDFYSFAAYFGRLGRKGTGISAPISGSEEVFFTAPTGVVKHPNSGKIMLPKPLFPLPSLSGTGVGGEGGDPRHHLAAWVVNDHNPYFAKVAVNRIWADLMGRGLVEPIDDMRATNPPSNGPLLDALAQHFVKVRYDQKKLLRTIMTSHVYGLSSIPGKQNVGDLRNYSRHYRQRLRGEVLLDALTDITGVPEAFAAAPPGTRAMELWTVRTQSVFLDSFGRPDPNQDPPCERTSDTSVVQALHLMNSPRLHAKVTSDDGRAAKLAASKKTPQQIVDELYLLVYNRPPRELERKNALRRFEGVPRRQATEDLLWALLNTPEFVFKD